MKRNVVFAFVVLILLWGSSFAVVKVGLGVSPPLLFAGFRALIGGAVMLVVAFLFGGKADLRGNLGAFAMLTLLNVVLFIGLQTFAVMELPSGVAAVLVYLQPVLVGLLAWYLLGEGLSAAKVAGLLTGLGGIIVVSVGGLSGDVTLAGIAFGALSALFWALGTVYFKRVQERISPLWSVAVPFFVGGLVLSALGFATESVGEVRLGGAYFWSLAYSAIAGVAASWLIWFALVRAGEASRVAAYIFAVPVTAVLIGVLALGEELRPSLALGGLLVVSGIYLVNRSPSKTGPAEGESVDGIR